MISTGIIRPPGLAPADYRTFISVGPFDEIAPGETIAFSFALVVTPRNDLTHVTRAAEAYHGLWFDLDGNPGTGIDGKEHQEHWYLPTDDPLPIAITSFQARAIDTRAVRIAWEVAADETIDGFSLLRGAPGAVPRSLVPGLLAPSTRLFVDVSVTPGARYEYVLLAHSQDGFAFPSQTIAVQVPAAALSLEQNAPNPFAESTTIGIVIPDRSEVEVAVYDVTGARVATIASGMRAEGEYELIWNGIDDAGNRVGAGVYFYRLKSGGETLTRKLVLMR